MIFEYLQEDWLTDQILIPIPLKAVNAYTQARLEKFQSYPEWNAVMCYRIYQVKRSSFQAIKIETERGTYIV